MGLVPNINKKGIDLIRKFEGCKLKAYADPASPLAIELRKPIANRKPGWEKLAGDPWTIGWGSTGLDIYTKDTNGNHPPIGPNTTWTQAQCDDRNIIHINEFAFKVKAILKLEINENQFAALVSFAYNVGPVALGKSTLLKLVNESKFDLAAQEFMKWTKAQGKELPGLVKRREAERQLFLTPP